MKCKDCGAAKTTICHDEWWLCTNTYEAYRKDEIAALRSRIRQLEDAVEWACTLKRKKNSELDCVLYELRRRAGRER